MANRHYAGIARSGEHPRSNQQVRNPNFIDPNQELLVYVR